MPSAQSVPLAWRSPSGAPSACGGALGLAAPDGRLDQLGGTQVDEPEVVRVARRPAGGGSGLVVAAEAVESTARAQSVAIEPEPSPRRTTSLPARPRSARSASASRPRQAASAMAPCRREVAAGRLA